MSQATKSGQQQKQRLKPLSLYPLKAEDALRLFMQVDPGKIGDKGALISGTMPDGSALISGTMPTESALISGDSNSNTAVG
jgi:hypothetical protein